MVNIISRIAIYLVNFLIEFGQQLKIIYPEKLKLAYLNKLKAIIDTY